MARLNKKKQDRIWGLLLIPLFVFLFTMVYRENKVMRRYGVKIATPHIGSSPRCKGEVMMVFDIKKGGAFDKAGIKFGDVIIYEESNYMPVFIKSLKRPPGDTLYIKIIPAEHFEVNCDPDYVDPIETKMVIAPPYLEEK